MTRPRRLACLAGAAFVVAALVSTARGRAQDGEQRVFRGGVDLIQVDTYPTKDGRPVEGLTAADFQVFEDGKPQTIQQVEFIQADMNAPVAARRDPATQEAGNAAAADGRNRAVVIYLDTYHVTVDGSSRTRFPLVGFLERMLGANDVFAVTAPQLRPRDLVFVRSTTTLQQELEKVWIWGRQPASLQAFSLEPDEVTLSQCYGWLGHDKYLEETVRRRREDRVLSHLEDLVTYVGQVREARKTLVILTRGWRLFGPDEATARAILKDQYGSLPVMGVSTGGSLSSQPAPGATRDAWCAGEIIRLYNMDSDVRLRHLIELANRNNVAFYPVNPVGLEPVDIMSNDPAGAVDSLRLQETSFKTLAENTGGLWGLRNDLDANLHAIANDVSAYYLISYYSTNANLDGRYRKIEVKVVRQPGVSVRARPGYVAASTATARTASPSSTSAPRVAPALARLARLDNPAGLYLQTSVAAGVLSVIAEVASGKADGEAWTGGGDLSVAVVDSAGAPLEPGSALLAAGTRGARFTIPLGSSRGPWRVTVKAAAKDETLDEVATVPADAAGAAGEAVLFRAPLPVRAAFTPAAEPQFRRTERVRLEWPVSEAPTERSARLLDKLGQPMPFVPAVTERQAPDASFLAVDFPLTALSPGDYVVELNATVRGDRITRFGAIRVVR